jgi:hypothetical protein
VDTASQRLTGGHLLPALAVFVAIGCGSSPTGLTTPTGPTAPGPPTGGLSTCSPRPNPAPGPVTDPNGPLYHQVVIARTSDGVTLTDPRIVLPAASVPDGVQAPDGRVLVYYVNGARHGLWVGAATATTLEPIGPIMIDGVPDPLGIVDPDAYRVGNRIRLAYLASFPQTGERAVCLAESDDGLDFRTIGTAMDLRAAGTITDPSVVQLPGGSWLMALSSGQMTRLARSADGVAYSLGETLAVGGVPELAVLADGTIRLYACAAGIIAYRSSDAVTWHREQVVASRGPNGSPLVCDPSYVAGTDLFVFKTGM